MEQLKIFFTLTVSFNPNEGGVQRSTFKMGKYFHEQGHKVYYFSLEKEGHVNAEFGSLLFSDESGGINNQSNRVQLTQLLDDIKPNIVINQMPPEKELRNLLFESKKVLKFKLIGCLRNSLFKVKDDLRFTAKNALPNVIFTLFDHKLGLWFLFKVYKVKFRLRLRDVLKKHDYYVLLAPPNKIELEYYVGKYCAEKVFIIPNSIPFVDSEESVKEKIILHVGRLTIEQKRSDLLLPIWKQIQSRLPDWKFLIIGDGDYKSEMEEQIVSENIKNVELKGFKSPEEYYQKASLFVMTSAFEGFPNVILEAQSYGLVTFAFNTYQVLPWLVNDKKDSILIKPYDIDEMADRIIDLVEKPKDLEKMSCNALNNADQFTIDNVGKIWVDFFNKII